MGLGKCCAVEVGCHVCFASPSSSSSGSRQHRRPAAHRNTLYGSAGMKGRESKLSTHLASMPSAFSWSVKNSGSSSRATGLAQVTEPCGEGTGCIGTCGGPARGGSARGTNNPAAHQAPAPRSGSARTWMPLSLPPGPPCTQNVLTWGEVVGRRRMVADLLIRRAAEAMRLHQLAKQCSFQAPDLQLDALGWVALRHVDALRSRVCMPASKSLPLPPPLVNSCRGSLHRGHSPT